MPRYYFHTLNGLRHRDVDGEILAGPVAACEEARALFAEVLGRGDSGFTAANDFTVLCTDEAGRPVVAYTASTAPVALLGSLVERLDRPEGG
ncbi:DUF6894 family protein [Brevundimonas sp. Root1279]|uniref:DUF6894 family protein n=1 Tax=Brevundimonas sp. Root1279 TaxID=1736443 RepID=UPI0006F2F41B|nr:hypothetical protein [Brevundimonas sp. Root1279]KQW80753.1 hypothetical protein ASC65_12310 [Brevundimonas sp. Root1279]